MSLPRLPLYEWAARAARGELDGLEWADARPDPNAIAFTMDAAGNFTHRAYAAMVPPPMAEAALDAHDDGQPTLLAGLSLLFARPEWTLHGRALLWTPLSPVPPLIAQLLTSAGQEPALHGEDPGRISALVARLRAWQERPGELVLAVELLRAMGQPVREAVWVEREWTPLQDEVLACHGTRWWTARAPVGARIAPRIQNGWVLFQSPETPIPLLREDVPVAAGAAPSLTLLARLLTPWSTMRVFSSAERPE